MVGASVVTARSDTCGGAPAERARSPARPDVLGELLPRATPTEDWCWRTTAESGVGTVAELAAPGPTESRIIQAPIASVIASGSRAIVGIPTSRRKMRNGRLPRIGVRSLATAFTSEPER